MNNILSTSIILAMSINFQVIIAGLIFLAVGLFNFFFPKKIYRISERWKHKEKSEPSTLFIVSTKIIGAVISISGILFLMIPIIY